MHQALRIPEILLNIFGCCSMKSLPERRYVDLAVLARTCRTFKEPALDLLWEKLYELSPLARCLPDACHLAKPVETGLGYSWWNSPCYTFSRPLKEAEWIALRGYTRRVRFIRVSFVKVSEEAIRVLFSLTPFDDPLFPHLESLFWNSTGTFPPLHVAVPSLKVVHLNLDYMSLPTSKEFLNAFGDRCPHMERLEVDSFFFGRMDLEISHLVCRWPKLQRVACFNVALNMDVISPLSFAPNLKSLAFRAEIDLAQDISHLDSNLVFTSLTNLHISSRFLDTITSLLRYIRLPALEMLTVVAEGYLSRWAIQSYWGAIRAASPSNVLTYLKIHNSPRKDDAIPPNDRVLPCVTLDVLRPCTTFAELRRFDVDFACPVNLTDADILELVSPRMESFLVNNKRGWQIHADGGGITLSGLVQLLRKCPSLNCLCLAIDARTFTEIPHGLDVSFPARRQLEINLVDSYIVPEFIPGLVSAFTALGIDSSMLTARFVRNAEKFRPLWKRVFDAL